MYGTETKYYLPLSLVGILTGVSISAFFFAMDYAGRALLSVPMPVLAFLSIPAAYLASRLLSDTKKTGSGTDRFLEVYHSGHGVVSARSTAASALSSFITLVMGGSAGPEGPGLTIGAGLGSWLARRFGLDPEDVRRLHITGAAAGIASVFRAPLTGLLFALEIPYMHDVETGVFVSALVAVAASYTVTVLFLGTEQLFPFQSGTVAVTAELMVNSIVLGAISALVALLFMWLFGFMKAQAKRLPAHLTPLVGGAAMAAIAALFPEVTGIGFDVIKGIGSGGVHLTLPFALALVFVKVVATSVTLSSGGSGGLFLPSIFVGTALGAAYATATGQPDVVVMMAAAVAGVFAAVNKTLLTSILLVSETFGPVVLLPSIAAALVSFLMTKNRSIHEHQLPRKVTKKEMVLEIFNKRLSNLLKDIKVGAVMTVNPHAVDSGVTVGEALDAARKLDLHVIPVVSKGAYVGLVTLDLLLQVPREKLVSEAVVFSDPVSPEDRLDEVIRRILDTNETHLFVIDREARLLGVITQSDVIRKVFDLISCSNVP